MKYFFLLIFFLSLFIMQKDALADRESDSLALVALYNELDGNNWTNNTGWLVDSVWLEDWYGITTSAAETGYVTRISLVKNKLSGDFPDEIGDFGNIESIILRDNNISGSLPQSLGNLTTLEWLDLGENNISGGIPTEIENLTELFRLYLNDNSISGSFIDEMYSLTSLATLELQNNNITSTLSSDIENLASLSIINIGNNNFSGTLPAEMSSLSSLVSITANNNGFTGSIPSEWSSITYINTLDLSNNSLTGNIPTSFSSLNWLQTLDVSHNDLSGSLPNFLHNIYNLSRVFLNNNSFSGSIPSSLGEISFLQYLDLSHNSLTGTIPNSFSGHSRIIELLVNNNNLSGNIPSLLTSLPKLKILDLSYNSFTGNILTGFGNMSSLNNLYLNNNNLSGSIPSSLGNSSSLRRLYFDNNNLTNSIPDELGNIGFLTVFSASNNSLSGSFPTEFKNCIIFNTLDISNNELSGTIPIEIGDYSSIRNINISNNSFTGELPGDITDNLYLEYLYIQNNEFTNIPNFSNLTRFKGFNVAGNKLQFDALEPNVGAPSVFFTVSPQEDIGEETSLSVELGDFVELNFSVAGDNNEYQWTKDGTDIPDANSDTYTIASYDASYDGNYVLEVSNTVVTDLIIYSANTELELGLSAPTLVAPGDAATAQPLNPIIEWNEVTNADSYEIEISDSEQFTFIVFNDVTTNLTINIPHGTLDASNTYYWRVKAIKGDDESNWSVIWSFTTIIGIPELSTPENNSTDISNAPLMTWSAVANADDYGLQISENGDFSVIILDKTGVDNINNNQFQLTEGTLEKGKEYFWKARAANSQEIGNWSEIWSFITKLGTPDILAPSDNQINVVYQPTFEWDAVSNADNYDLRIATDLQFSNIVHSETTIENLTYTLSAITLASYTQYFWQVRALNDISTGDWSEPFSFTTKLNTPVLTDPSDESINVDINPDFAWSENTEASEYDFRISTDETFATSAHTETVTSNSLSLTLYDLSYNTEYFWHVKAKDGVHESNWSDVFSFTTLLEAPVLDSPYNEAINIAFQPELSWNAADGAVLYSIEIADDEQFNNIIENAANIDITQYQITEILSAYTTYYWRVKSHNGVKESNFSAPFSFTTKITAPELTAPADESVNIDVNPDFEWTTVGSVTDYIIRISVDETFEEITYSDTVTSNSLNLTIHTLSYNTEYFWQVKAKDDDNESNWSDVFSFTTILEAPVLISPENESEDIELETTFVWDSVEDAEEYELAISLSNDFEEVLISQTSIMGSDYDMPEGYLEGSTDYFWKVKSRNGNKTSNWSDTFKFRTVDVDLNININKGWNLISSNIIPENLSMQVVFDTISDSIVIVRNAEGSAYIPAYGLNRIGNWNYLSGYRVYASEPVILTITGSKVKPENATIYLNEGLNLVPYLRDSAIDIETALLEITSDIVIVKDNSGNIYIPSLGINTIGNMHMGKAYWIYTKSATQFTYPAN